ncbi:hypothetical protein K493DRAFT_641 [Basidiobolus meristosporus CBS 931.73]|uniref:Coiled-coil domain-containing protein 6 n=1 Tax=Basidiobolus meristosporus CBS 931.73 TaxID=1314790 RepID=A0A1Y1ZDS1_9FUNG|nr:hypothetical protein K493DRAFT_641 [Basidiobolus meristosporus CBS 931.73]|eukprot:ORY08433.1 hypothetical protein K493DRAFT_641 [Basidiobolus meristosporus CBS 931.73]
MKNSLEYQLNQNRKSKADLEGRTSTVLADTNNVEELRKVLQEYIQRSQDQERSIKRLQFDLEMEIGHVNILRHENQTLKQLTVDMHASAEQEEEYISNKLLKSIAHLKKEKAELLVQVEREEEYLTNTLQRKLSQLQKEKIDLENALEQEQEFMVNRLQKQLDVLRLEQSQKDLGTSPPSPSLSSSPPAPRWRPTHSPSSSDVSVSSHAVTEVLKAEVTALRIKQTELEKEFTATYNQLKIYKNELIELRKKNNLPVDDLLSESSAPSFMRFNNATGKQRSRRSISSGDQSQLLKAMASPEFQFPPGPASPEHNAQPPLAHKPRTD